MASFKTCFTPEWYYHSVFECESVKEAFLLEQSVLYCLREKRVPFRELVKLDAAALDATARKITEKLNLQVVYRSRPHYAQDELICRVERNNRQGENNNDDSLPEAVSDEVKRTITQYVSVLDGIGNACLSNRSAVMDYGLHSIENGDWDECGLENDFAFPSLFDETYSLECLRPYQVEAVKKVRAELERSGRAVCQMACRCGKTPVAYQLILDYVKGPQGNDHSGRILYLVPGLALLRQTAQKLYGYGLDGIPLLLIGSDPYPVLLSDYYQVTMTTDADHIRKEVLSHAHILVISTYQSSPLLRELNIFSLTVFDECHRLCGSLSQTTFNTLLFLPLHGKRLFLTATPTYDTPLKMSNEHLFGGIAYRYYLRDGIDAGFVNSFSVRVVLGSGLHDMNPYLFEAMRMVNKMLVFCRNIQHAEDLCRALADAQRPEGVQPFNVLIAHSGMGSSAVATVLGQFVTERRCVLFNVRLFQEGVEIPDLNAVFFAAPRYSSRDIIQSICRPLNKLEGKPPSFVFLPAVLHEGYAEDHPINLESFSTLIPFADALMDEDPVLFEYMIDPQKVAYDFSVVGVRALQLTDERIQRFILPAIRRGVRYSALDTDRLHRASRMPWKYVFREMRRIVMECNRYPKTNDAWVVGGTSLSMSQFYNYCRKGYQVFERGERTFLQTYQLRDLESLPEWKRYGVQGPYPWKECMSTLDKYLRKYRKPPPLDVHKGGYIGLDATPFERLSGCLMHVNQCDARLGMRLAADKQEDLDKLCARYGIRWRKERDSAGVLVKNSHSFITSSYSQFKRLFAARETCSLFQQYLELHYPGYPEKHNRMETRDNLKNGRVPPRHDPRKKRRPSDSKSGMQVSEEVDESTVMCRICRVKVQTREWAQHVISKEHNICADALASNV